MLRTVAGAFTPFFRQSNLTATAGEEKNRYEKRPSQAGKSWIGGPHVNRR
jgi:hypothetical protein